ncbi:MAG: hypothetical protein M0R80_00575 [Proteobacteria bacterium]|jgi:hypothetical protein|nr:hypothetical protein [Pseudomonadota bacterium]
MEYYRHVYRNSQLWLGDDLKDKRVMLYCEQGLGDNIQFLRYLPRLQALGCHVIVHCSSILHPLLPYAGAKEWLDKDNEILPEHDYHVLSLDLPFVLSSAFSRSTPGAMQRWWMGESLDEYMPQINKDIPQPPYIHFNEKEELPSGTNVGICWSGNPNHYNDDDRSCHLKEFKGIKGRLISLQKDICPKWTTGAEDMELLSNGLNDLLDTMRLINAVDFVVSVDSLVMHLAGALNKKTYCLLGDNPDPRWGNNLWYPSVTFCHKSKIGELT